MSGTIDALQSTITLGIWDPAADGKAGQVVKRDATQTVGTTGLSGAGEGGYILALPVAQGMPVRVLLPGVKARGLLGGTVAIGNKLAADASGDLVVATTGDMVVAEALSAGADTEEIEIITLQHVAILGQP